MPNVDQVKSLLALGFSVFPCKVGGKDPATYDGFYSASKSEDQVEAWFASGAKNVGIATGKASGVVVIDFDSYKEGSTLSKLEEKLGALPLTKSVRTRAGGMHLFYRLPDGKELRSWNGTLGLGVDLRGDKGYVVGVGSYVGADKYGPAGGYQWEGDCDEIANLPDAWADLWEKLNDEKVRKQIRAKGI